MKQLVIDVNSFILYAALAVLVVFGFIILGTAGDPLVAGAYLGAAFIAWCLISGLWFLLVAIYEELVKLNKKVVR